MKVFRGFFENYEERKYGAGDRSRTYTALRPEDFESSASAIPPLRHSLRRGYINKIGGG